MGYRWDETKFPVWFRTSIESEKPQAGEGSSSKAVPGGESLVLIDGRSFGEINVYHQFLDLTEFADGKSHVIDIQTVPKGCSVLTCPIRSLKAPNCSFKIDPYQAHISILRSRSRFLRQPEMNSSQRSCENHKRLPLRDRAS